jgi:cell division protease FtsH
MAWIMDQEIRELISKAEKQSEEVLTNNRQALVALADALVKEEVLEREDIERIIKQAS